jgi:hypothetical protein
MAVDWYRKQEEEAKDQFHAAILLVEREFFAANARISMSGIAC